MYMLRDGYKGLLLYSALKTPLPVKLVYFTGIYFTFLDFFVFC